MPEESSTFQAGDHREAVMAKLLKLIRDDQGATAIEYALIAALISVAAIGAFVAVGSSLTTTFSEVASQL